MPTPIEPDGSNAKQPSAWKKACAWKKDDIPQYPGTYEISYGPNGCPEGLPSCLKVTEDESQEHTNCDQFKGVIYIGKAVCFKHRFWNLIETWQKEDSK